MCGWLRSPNDNNNGNNAFDVENGIYDNNNVNNDNNGVVPDLLLSKEKSQRVDIGMSIACLKQRNFFLTCLWLGRENFDCWKRLRFIS